MIGFPRQPTLNKISLKNYMVLTIFKENKLLNFNGLGLMVSQSESRLSLLLKKSRFSLISDYSPKNPVKRSDE